MNQPGMALTLFPSRVGWMRQDSNLPPFDRESSVLSTIDHFCSFFSFATGPSRHSNDSDARRHVCPFCPASFKRKDHVTRHVTDTHSLVTKLFDCSTCDAKFQSASHLRQHERLHEDRGGFYECPVCKERIVRKKGFKRHLDLHKKAATDEVSTSGCFPSLTGLNSQNSCSAFDQQTLTRQFF